jgi:hypothetical protein
MPNKTRRKRGSTKRTLTKRSRRLMRHMRRIKTRRGGTKVTGNQIRNFASQYKLVRNDSANLEALANNPTPEALESLIEIYNENKAGEKKFHENGHQMSLNGSEGGWGPFIYERQSFLDFLYELKRHMQ